MTPLPHRMRRRPDMRRAVILFPSGLTLGNLFFGVFAIIAASRFEFVAAGVYVLLGGICDALDGRVARATNAGTEFGEELDSLVDAITFGLAPGMIMYFAVLNRTGWDWVWVFIFAACAVLRLARFNIEQAGTSKTYFQGLPSPAAGITLASYYWFSQSSLYTYGAIADLKWHVLLRYLMVVLSFLMISNVPYPVFPRTGFRSLRSIGATILVIGSLTLLATRKLEYFFPFALVYVAWGLIRWVFSGLFERRQPTLPYDLSEGEDDDEDDEPFELTASQVHATRQGHREERAERAERLRTERNDRTRSRTERSRTAAPAERAAEPVAERPARAPDAERLPRDKKERPKRAERPPRSERPDRAERADRPERPARDERPREPRPPREERLPRAPREERPVAAAVNSPSGESGVDAITLGEPTASELTLSDTTLAAPLGAAAEGGAANAPPADGTAAPRKRKRRRRRGERKDRPTAGEAGGASGDAGDSGDEGDNDDMGDDNGRDDNGRDAGEDSGPYARPEPERASPGASPAAEPAPRPAPPSAPQPTQQAAPQPAPAPVPYPSSESEPAE